MRLANVDARAAIVLAGSVADVAETSGGRFGPDLRSVFDEWAEFRAFAATVTAGTAPLDLSRLGCPAPEPRQVFAIGMNYRAHAGEIGIAVPGFPATFTKFPSSLAGPFDEVEVMPGRVDWEVELVAVIGRQADRVAESDGWAHIAGLTVGQDISDRQLQFEAGSQFSLGKSRRGYGPMGPLLVTPDELAEPDDLSIGCSIDGEIVQEGRTSDLVLGVPRLVAELSAVLPLLPGDVLFTGTPAGVGFSRRPPRWLEPGTMLESWVDGVGRMRNPIVEALANGRLSVENHPRDLSSGS